MNEKHTSVGSGNLYEQVDRQTACRHHAYVMNLTSLLLHFDQFVCRSLQGYVPMESTDQSEGHRLGAPTTVGGASPNRYVGGGSDSF